MQVKKFITGALALMMFICIGAGNVWMSNQGEQTPLAVATSVQADKKVSLPVLMYHQVSKKQNKLGDYVVSPQQFEDDLKELERRGYETVSSKQVLDYISQQGTLPKKPVMITFDDGYEGFYEYAYPLLQQYHAKAVLSIIGKFTDLYSAKVAKGIDYSHVSWNQLKEMQESGLIEVGNHTYELHQNGKNQRKGVRQQKNESDEDYHDFLVRDLTSLNQEITKELGVVPTIFAYPFGAYSKTTKGILEEIGFQLVLTCEEKINYLSPNEEASKGALSLGRFNRSSKFSVAEYFKKIEP